MASESDRSRLLLKIHRALAEYSQASALGVSSQSAEAQSAATGARERLAPLLSSYKNSLFEVLLSRCPITWEPLAPFFDSQGLDGIWWNYERPYRPWKRPPATFLALTGSVKLGAALENFPFLCRPGPEVPFVLPELINIPGIMAVISNVRIGPHQGYPIAYFSSGTITIRALPNDWGAGLRYAPTEGEDYEEIRGSNSPGEYDYDLAKYIRSEKLLWIAPGDGEAELRKGLQDCPYLHLEGEKTALTISRGIAKTDLGVIVARSAEPDAAIPGDPGTDEASRAGMPPPLPGNKNPAAKAQWFYELDGKPAGPVDEPTLVDMLRTGKLPPDVNVWNASLKEWKRASSSDALRSHLAQRRTAPQTNPAAVASMPARIFDQPKLPRETLRPNPSEDLAAPERLHGRFGPRHPPMTTADATVCGKCGAALPRDARFCRNCGAPVLAPNPISAPGPAQEPGCPRCATPVIAGASFCRACGFRLGS